jgi:hypothetical protein
VNTYYITGGAVIGVILLILLVMIINIKVRTKNKMLCEIVRRDGKSESVLCPLSSDGKFVIVQSKNELKRYVIPTSEQGGTLFTQYPIGGISIIQTVIPKLIFIEDNTESLQIAKNALGLQYSGASASVLGNAYKPYAFQEFVNAVERSEGRKGGQNLAILTLILLVVITLGTLGSVYFGFKNADTLSSMTSEIHAYLSMMAK